MICALEGDQHLVHITEHYYKFLHCYDAFLEVLNVKKWFYVSKFKIAGQRDIFFKIQITTVVILK